MTRFLADALGANLVYQGLSRSDEPIGRAGIQQRLGVPGSTRLRSVRLIRLAWHPFRTEGGNDTNKAA